MAAMAFAVPAKAGLLGSSATAFGLFPDSSTVLNSSGPVTVDGSIEFPAGSLPSYPFQSIQVTDTQIIIASHIPGGSSAFTSVPFNGFELLFTGAPAITNAVVDGASNLDPVGVSFAGDQVLVNFEGLPYGDGSTTIIDVTTGAVAVAEPATLALLGASLAGFGALRRRKGA